MSRSCWLLLAGSLFLVGCGEGGSDVSTVPVTGVVTLDGNPLPGASVSFSPKDSTGRAAVGMTDMDGKFSLMTVSPGDGAVPGEYGVTVTKGGASASGPKEDPRSSGGKMSPEDTKKMMESLQQGKVVEQKSGLPEKYASAATSGFQASVASSGENNFTFALTSN